MESQPKGDKLLFSVVTDMGIAMLKSPDPEDAGRMFSGHVPSGMSLTCSTKRPIGFIAWLVDDNETGHGLRLPK